MNAQRGRGGVLALIPARGGSKRLPGKNIRPLGGIPMIAHTVRAALASPRLDRTILSTDDPAIAEAVRAAGGEAPFLRPEHLATDAASSVDVALHAIDFCEAEGRSYEWLVLLQPTSPLRSAEDIEGCLSLCLDQGAEAAVTVTLAEKPLNHYGRLDAEGRFDREALGEAVGSGSLAALTGACYVLRVETLRRERSFLPEGVRAWPTPWERAVDVDVLADFELAERLLAR
ncbi:acylneuraminate cytidylyltransferase family protein [Neomegalonema sp.]|uniref:acylneuraminate cytidylyltransferase family protein n=1 Tax=Neomegalonema sp. TaxID=2039713 RepID=UPI00261E6E7F|nr:acylneuraminate cytidylyltransferase family protein [Neomegalonema sp.]MDD2867471.1 acylneuraminate cytidylyltransferase family protein [Neomegalonema sp.]